MSESMLTSLVRDIAAKIMCHMRVSCELTVMGVGEGGGEE